MHFVWHHMTVAAVVAVSLTISAVIGSAGTTASAGEPVCQEQRRFNVPEARQGVAVDAEHFYAIDNRVIAKYTKSTGALVQRWEASETVPLVHLNAGVVVGRKLYCAHSNYPHYPDTSSVEIWDTGTLEHIGSKSFGITDGSLTWIDYHDSAWWAVFAHYSNKVGRDGRTKGTAWTRLVMFDADWQPRQSWVFPEEVVCRFEPSSNSGGMWGPDGHLYCTGHDAAELYGVSLPRSGSVLRLTAIIPTSFPGQAFAWDRTEPGILYAVDRAARQVVVSRLVEPDGTALPDRPE